MITAIAVACSAYYGYHNNQLAHSNARKLDDVKTATDGTQHTLANTLQASQTKNEDLIRELAARPAAQGEPPHEQNAPPAL